MRRVAACCDYCNVKGAATREDAQLQVDEIEPAQANVKYAQL